MEVSLWDMCLCVYTCINLYFYLEEIFKSSLCIKAFALMDVDIFFLAKFNKPFNNAFSGCN